MTQAYPADRPLFVRRRVALLGAGVAAYLLFRMLALMPGVAEVLYAGSAGSVIAWMLSRVSGLLPISVFELLIVAFLARQAVGAGGAIRDAAKKTRGWRNALAAGALRLGQDAGVLVVLFYVLWGFNYARVPLATRIGLPAVDSVTVDELATLSRAAIDAVNGTYLELHGTEDVGGSTRVSPAPEPLFASLQEGWRRVRDTLALERSAGWRYGPPKSFLFAPIVKRIGTAGMYSPFTGEPLLIGDLPAISYWKAVAHEQAHQRGVAHETEANFLGYLVAAWTPEPEVRYSAHAFAMVQLMNSLGRADPHRWRAEAERIVPGVRRDLDSLRAFWARYEGPLDEIGDRANEAFLRTNRIPEGRVAYSRSVELLIAFARSRAVAPDTASGDL